MEAGNGGGQWRFGMEVWHGGGRVEGGSGVECI